MAYRRTASHGFPSNEAFPCLKTRLIAYWNQIPAMMIVPSSSQSSSGAVPEQMTGSRIFRVGSGNGRTATGAYVVKFRQEISGRAEP